MGTYTFYSRAKSYSKSYRAEIAESEERYPLSRASKILASKLGWSIAKSKAFLKDMGTSEYHHVGKFANEIDYYDVSDDFLEGYQEEIESYQYVAPKKKVKTTYFKCWNFEGDVRRWEYYLTNRDGNHCHDMSVVFKKAESILRESLKNRHLGNKTNKRIIKETIKSCIEILRSLKL